ncbi:hypothetical protein PILCRDRAFT_738486 [Piloderma croceum F 1598]|uniref:Uncharacterized protein n=1 Tax=Piloderma croceum (strain F 1598) TaxID=765440 RepID=A0A0C3B5Z0_PILCF|nr:hypothetical protein PILCRDRAFT_738486 [Piloderma croceum F 1598]
MPAPVFQRQSYDFFLSSNVCLTALCIHYAQNVAELPILTKSVNKHPRSSTGRKESCQSILIICQRSVVSRRQP